MPLREVLGGGGGEPCNGLIQKGVVGYDFEWSPREMLGLFWKKKEGNITNSNEKIYLPQRRQNLKKKGKKKEDILSNKK